MADISDSPPDGAVGTPRKPRFGGWKARIILLGVLCLVALALGLWAALRLNASGDDPAAYQSPPAGPEGVTPGLALLPVDPIVVNVTGFTASGAPVGRHMRINLTLVYDVATDTTVAGQSELGGLAARMPYLRDAFVEFLGQLTERDITGSLGLAMLRAELLKRARAVSGGDAPREVLISDLVLQ